MASGDGDVRRSWAFIVFQSLCNRNPLMQNIMMMFATNLDRLPFPTAVKLRQLEHLYERNEGRAPTESELAQLASLSRGEVRRLKNILCPKEYLRLIENEQELLGQIKPRQWITSVTRRESAGAAGCGQRTRAAQTCEVSANTLRVRLSRDA